MITEKDIKPIPKNILKLIKERDKKDFPHGDGKRRFYAYLAKFGGELVKVTVAVKNRNNKARDWVHKQVAVHCIHSDLCLIKDMVCYYIAGYVVGWHEQGLYKTPKWFEQEHWWEDYNTIEPVAPIVNTEFALKFPKYKYSAANKYTYCNLFEYLRIYEEYPQAEYLVKMKLPYLATSKVILKKIGKDKNFRKWIIQNSEELAKKRHFINIITQTYKEKSSLRYNQYYTELEKVYKNHDAAHEVVRLIGSKDRFFDYIIRHETNLATYKDYFEACNYLHLDMTDTKNLMPIDFKRWHDIRIDEYRTAKALQDAEERKELYAQFASVAEKYLPLQRNKDNAFIVVIAKSPQDLIREGDTLHHCVGRMNYDRRVIREESLIFFVRDKQAPDVPFVTVEYSLSQRKVLQCYGEYDHRPSDNVLDFVNHKWLPFANNQLNRIQAAAIRKGVFIMNNYYRITGYCEQEDFCFIMDCYGMFEKLWQFSSCLIQKGLKVLEVGNETKFMDGNIDRIDENGEKMFLRANADGKPEYTTQTINGITYKAVKVADKIYIPDRTQTV